MRLALVEDHPLLAENLIPLLATLPGHSGVATYAMAEDAQSGLRPGQADLLIADFDLPGLSEIEMLRRARGAPLHLPTLVWTIHEDRVVVYAALKAGAMGYLLKGCDARELEASLREIEAGGAPMSPSIARRVLQEFVGEPEPVPTVELTLREGEVLRAVAAGHSYKEIASRLGLSAHTVHAHVKNSYGKLHARGERKPCAGPKNSA